MKRNSLLLMLVWVALCSGCTISEAPTTEATTGPYHAYRIVRDDMLVPSVGALSQIIYANAHLETTQDEDRYWMEDYLFAGYRVAWLNGVFHMSKIGSSYSSIVITPIQGASILEPGAVWEWSQRDVGTIKVTCLETDRWEVDLDVIVQKAEVRKGSLLIERVPLQVSLPYHPESYEYQYRIVRATGKLDAHQSVGDEHYREQVRVVLDYKATAPIGVFYNMSVPRFFDGALSIHYDCTPGTSEDCTATLGSWFDQSVLISWGEHQKVWAQ